MISIIIEAETPAQVIDKLQAMLATWTPSVVQAQAPVPEAAAGNGSGKIHTLPKPKAVAKAKPEPEAEPEPEVTLDQLKQAVTEFLNANEKEATLKLLQKYGKSSNISGIDKARYRDVYDAARAGI